MADANVPDQSLYETPGARRAGAREAILVVLLSAVLLVLLAGGAVRSAGEEMNRGVVRSVVLAVGEPTGWIADRLPLAEAVSDVTSGLSPDEDLGSTQSVFARAGGGGSAAAVPPVTPDAFDPGALGERPPRPGPLRTLLVTGDSLSMPLDAQIARDLSSRRGVRVVRDPRLGTGISKSDLLDWGRLSVAQERRQRPDAVVLFIGANEGFPMPVGGGREASCCGGAWAAEYAFRVRSMMNVYRRGGRGRVYWLLLPMPRDRDRQRIARAVNAAITVAAQPYRAQVRVQDMGAIFTPGGRYRAAMAVGGRDTVVREPDGIHLNAAGARVAADAVLAAVRRDFG
jgi:lysophospholipase L1-like esterase